MLPQLGKKKWSECRAHLRKGPVLYPKGLEMSLLCLMRQRQSLPLSQRQPQQGLACKPSCHLCLHRALGSLQQPISLAANLVQA